MHARLRRDQREVLIELYERTASTVDNLPYTDEFENLYADFLIRTGLTMTRRDVWKALTGCRKSSRLVRKKR